MLRRPTTREERVRGLPEHVASLVDQYHDGQDDAGARYVLVSLVLAAEVLVFLALSVYPFQYGHVESLLHTVALVALGVFEFVLEDAIEGEG